jgi:hypothetical protein
LPQTENTFDLVDLAPLPVEKSVRRLKHSPASNARPLRVAGMLVNIALAFILVVPARGTFAQSAPSDKQQEAEARAQRIFSARLYLSELRRVERIVYPLLQAATPYCSNQRKYSIGIPPIAIRDLPIDLQRGYAESIDAQQDELRFANVAWTSPAIYAGVQEGDLLLSMTEQATGKHVLPGWVLDRPANTLVTNTPITLEIQRGSTKMSLAASPQLICDVRLTLTRTPLLIAQLESRKLTLSTGLLNFLPSDDEIAFLLANEVVHDQLRSTASPTAKEPVDIEYQADYFGTYLAVAAGFDLSKAGDVWKRIASDPVSQEPRGIGARHPLTPARSFYLSAINHEIRQKAQAGIRMVPEHQTILGLSDSDFDAVSAGYSNSNAKRSVEPVAHSTEDLRLRSLTDIPFIDNEGIAGYQRFLESPLRPRAFAIGPSKISRRGAWAFRFGSNAAADALTYCSVLARGPCYLYAIDDRVVWNAETARDQPLAPLESPHGESLGQPSATGFAPIGDLSAVPLSRIERLKYQAFLEKPSPRAFLITQDGLGLYWVGPAAMRDALAYCAHAGGQCWLYAVDDNVIWSEDISKRISRPEQLPAQNDESRFLGN